MNHIRTFTSHGALAFAEAGIIAVLILSLLVAPALAAKGGNADSGKGGGKPPSGSSSLSLVMVEPDDTAANHGDVVTFSVSTTATDRPFVSLHCYQDDAWVYAASVGFFPDYPWSQTFTLAATSWPSGAAACTATLYTTRDGTRITTLATLEFAVAP